MESWYQELGADRVAASRCFHWDYSDLTTLLAPVRGTVVDIGGGLGLARQYLASFDAYVIVEPSTAWLDDRWDALGDDFSCLREAVDFVRGFGERLPIQSDSSDAALALWTLNHASDPSLVIEEAHRVLHPGGYLLVVLEDMVPTTLDLEREPRLANLRVEPAADHTNIREDEFAEHARLGFDLIERRWVRHYLGFGFIRKRGDAYVSKRGNHRLGHLR